MEVRKGISSVVFVVIVCLCALWSSSTWAQAFSYSHAPDLPSTLSPSEKQSIQSYSLTVFKNALSKNGIDVHKIILNNGEDQLSHFVVNSGTWFSMETKGEYSLIGCTVSPPFDYNDFELAAPGWNPKNFKQNQ